MILTCIGLDKKDLIIRQITRITAVGYKTFKPQAEKDNEETDQFPHYLYLIL